MGHYKYLCKSLRTVRANFLPVAVSRARPFSHPLEPSHPLESLDCKLVPSTVHPFPAMADTMPQRTLPTGFKSSAQGFG